MATGALSQFAVLGHPVAHSLSPRLHRAFASQGDENISYLAIEVPRAQFESFWQAGVGPHLAGANITLPLKQAAFTLADCLSKRAERAGAVNTIKRQADGRLFGDNTDGIGLVSDLLEKLGASNRSALTGARLLLLGAGGAARGVLGPLLELQPAELLIANRTEARASELVARFSDLGPVGAIALDALPDAGAFDGVINASAAGHDGTAASLPSSLRKPGSWCYNLSYGAAARPFLDQAQAAGCQHNWDGLGMLIEQAAASFELWFGRRPETAALKSQVASW